MPSLSIIIPIYNVEAYLKQCLDSILVDNSFTGQVICVNDGSTDGSAAILEEYAAKYKNIEIITQLNAGLSAARNAGFDRATGEYVFFLDSDDWVLPNSLDELRKRIDGEEVIYFNTVTYEDDTQNYGNRYAIKEFTHISGCESFEKTSNANRSVPFVIVGGKLYKRSFMIENHLYNEPGIYHEDNYFTPQVHLASNDVSCINVYVYVYRLRQGSITTCVKEKHIHDLLYIARNLYATYQKRTDVADAFYSDVCNIYVNLILSALDNHIPLQRIWRMSDSRIMLRCARDRRFRRIAKLTFISPGLAYSYMQDSLSANWRRIFNRIL